jgi:hypothetical protein
MIERAVAALKDPARRARIVRWFWIISTGFTLFGFGVLGYLLFLGR